MCLRVQAAQLSETLSTCRFAQRMAAVAVDARRGTGGGLAALHGSLFRLDPVMQRYMEARSQCTGMLQPMQPSNWSTSKAETTEMHMLVSSKSERGC